MAGGAGSQRSGTLVLVLALAACMFACGGDSTSSDDGGGDTPAVDAPVADAPTDTSADGEVEDDTGQPPASGLWKPTTVPLDPACTTCVEIGTYGLDHGGVTVTRMWNPAIDDAVAQWADCLQGVFECMEDGGELEPCTAGAPCPDACKVEFDQEVATAGDREARFGAFDRTFIDEGAFCRPTLADVEAGP